MSDLGFINVSLVKGIYGGYIGAMEKKVETTV